jgi:5-methyltetrahydropteroyltriglutamate--homocysteine methyltransferase
MTRQQNTDRIQTTHIGSLPRPHDVLDLLRAKFAGQPYDEHVLDSTIANSVKESVRRQSNVALTS